MNIKKTLLTCAIGTAMGVGATAAQAVAVTSWTLTDYDSDGLQSDFNFVDQPPGNSGNKFGAGTETCGGGTTLCADVNMTGSAGQSTEGLFTTGFNFGGGGDFEPLVADNQTGGTTGAVNATIDTSGTLDGTKLTFSKLDWAGTYQGVNTFSMPPDHLQNCTGQPDGVDLGAGALSCGEAGSADSAAGLSNPLGYNVQISDLGGGDYGVVVDWAGTIGGTGTTYDGNEAHWRVEGIMHTAVIPVPAAVWLFGSGLLGLVGVARRRKGK